MTKHQKPVARLVSKRRPALSEVREAVNELGRLRNDMAHRPGARPIPDKDIRKAIHQGRR
jgi:antitoxin (DNA-binding transcriptional repressor) of toxin-antitoxin stability system